MLSLAVFACGPAVTSASFMTPPPEPKPADRPVAFYAEARPRCPYDEIGAVSARKRNASMNAVLEAIRARVRGMGGDAVIGMTQSQQPHGSVTVSGLVIRFRDQACME